MINLQNTVPAQPANTLPVNWQSDASGNVSGSVALIAPNVTTSQKNALSPSAGQIVLDTTLAKLCFWDGGAWRTVTSV